MPCTRICSVLTLTIICGAMRSPAGAEAGRVPAEFQDLYTALEQKIDSFSKTVGARSDGSPAAVNFAAELLSANGNRGRVLLLPKGAGARLEMDAYHSMGLQAVSVAIPFPLLDPSFLNWNGDPQDYQGFVNYYKSLVDRAHELGMKLEVEIGSMFPGIYSSGSGMKAAAYYAKLSDAELIEERARQIVAIAHEIKPDYINAGSEPETEFRLTQHSFYLRPKALADSVRRDVEALRAAGVTGVPLGAGTGTWSPRARDYVQELCRVEGLSVIDLHVYPVNRDFLDQAFILADQAHGCGKQASMSEAWLYKVRDRELGKADAVTDPTIFAREVFSFWAPLDQKFLAAMVKYARYEKLNYFSAFWSRYFFAYLDDDQKKSAQPPPSADVLLNWVNAAAAQGIIKRQLSETGHAYSRLVGASTRPPAVR